MGILAGGLRILNEKVEFVLSSRLGYGSETKKYLKVLGANTFFFWLGSLCTQTSESDRDRVVSDLWLEFTVKHV